MKLKARKERSFIHSIKLKESIRVFVKCDKCQDDKIPVYGNKSAIRALASHKGQCNGIKTNRNVNNYEYSATVNQDHDYELFEQSSDDGNVETATDQDNMETETRLVVNKAINLIKPFIACDDHSWHRFQMKLDESYLQSSLRINRRAHQDVAASVQDTVELWDLVTTENLTNQGIDKLLKYLHDMHKRHNVDIPLPGNHETLQRQCKSNIISLTNDSRDHKGIFDLIQHEYRLEPDVFPNHNNSILAYSYDIKQLIAEALLNMNPSDFIRNPDNRYMSNDKDNRIFEDFTTGYHFKNISEAVKRECNNCTALCIGFTLDDTQIHSGRRTFTPVHMFILNAINDSLKMILVGYAPGDKLPYSVKQMEDDLCSLYPRSTSKIGKKGVTEAFAKYQERKFQRDYLYDVFKAILATQANGVLLRVGRFDDPKAFNINACIHLTVVTTDNLQSEFLASTSMRSYKHKCRMCMSEHCHSIDPAVSIGDFRIDEDMQRIGTNLEIAVKEECKRTEASQSEETKQSFAAGREAGIQAGYNKLIDLFKWQNDRKINGFFQSLAPDYLHTVVKGCIEDAIAWSVCCLQALQDHDREYSGNMCFLDDRIKNFPIVQSLTLFENKPIFRWFEGISHLFKTSWHSKSGAGTGFFANGSIEGWKLPQLLFQLLFCINNDICPFAADWAENKRNLTYRWNVGRQIVNALASVLEVHFLCRRRMLTEKAINTTLTEAIKNSRSHMSLLRLMKRDLMSKDEIRPEERISIAIKPHLLAHIPQYKKTCGADQRVTDTEKSEFAHKDLKDDFDHTNKRYGTAYKDMLLNNRVKIHYKHLISSLKRPKQTTKVIHVSDEGEKPIQISDEGEKPCKPVDPIDLIFAETSDESSNEVKRVESNVLNEGKTKLSMVYKPVPTFGAPDLLHIKDDVVTVKSTVTSKKKYCPTQSEDLYTADSSGINNVLVTFEEVIKLAKDEKGIEFARCWKGFEQNKIRCSLVKAVRCYDKNKGKTPNDVVIHCNGQHEAFKGRTKCIRNICDFIEVKLKDDAKGSAEYDDDGDDDDGEIAQLVSIFSFSSHSKSNDAVKMFLLVCWMTKKKILRTALPYDTYVYGLTRNRKYLHLQIVAIETLTKPAWLISHTFKGPLYWSDVSKRTVADLKWKMFYSLPYTKVDRNHREEGFVAYDADAVDYDGYATSSSSSSSSRSSSSSSSSSRIVVLNDLEIVLSSEQQQAIASMVNNAGIDDMLEDKDENEDENGDNSTD